MTDDRGTSPDDATLPSKPTSRAGADGATLPSEPAPRAGADDGLVPTTGVAEPTAATWLPDRFDAIGAPLGTGTTAVVWPVRHVLDGREFALKVWRRPLADDAERERFRREVRRYVALNAVSGHIVTYSWAEENAPDGLPWIGMERHGESLRHVVEAGTTPLPQRLVLSADLLAGLAAMHSHGMLHRDVKPANVLAEGGRAKLCDLGLVLDSEGFTDDNAAGTPGYVAPELLSGDAAPSTVTDVYSAATTIRELLGSDLPAELDQLLTEAASVNPDDRPADATEFETRFRQTCAALGHRLPARLSARGDRQDEPAPASSNGQRTRGRVLAIAVAGLVVAATIALVVVRPWDNTGAGDGTTAAATTSVPTGAPDTAGMPNDITGDGKPIVLPATQMGRCNVAVDGAVQTDGWPYDVNGEEVAELRLYYSVDKKQACAKLVKPAGSPLAGTRTHLALTLCGDDNSCDFDWNAYPIDAGPVVVPSRDGCVSLRVSMMDSTGTQWLTRDDVRTSGCPNS